MARPMARMVISPPQGQPMLPDHPNWSWHEYGMRVGFWRLRKMMLSWPSPTVTLNARVCETYPVVVKACLDSGWELNAHGYDQVPMHKLDDQRAVIMKSMDVIEKFSGKRLRGWFGPGLTQTFDTLDYLGSRRRIHRRLGARRRARHAEDQPQAGRGPALQFRDPRHCDDGLAAPSVRSVARPGARSFQDAVRRVLAERPKVMAMACHPYLSGAPSHRTRGANVRGNPRPRRRGELDGAKILDWYLDARG